MVLLHLWGRKNVMENLVLFLVRILKFIYEHGGIFVTQQAADIFLLHCFPETVYQVIKTHNVFSSFHFIQPFLCHRL